MIAYISFVFLDHTLHEAPIQGGGTRKGQGTNKRNRQVDEFTVEEMIERIKEQYNK